MRILIVDDSAMMRKMIAKTLQGGGHEVVGEASSGEQAIELFNRLSPDMVTMDITMRGMDGFEAARAILAQQSDAKILFLSNLDDEKYGAEVSQIGGLGLVTKHKPADILALINSNA